MCQALTDAALSGKKIPMIGAGGILVEIPENLDEKNGKVLFLPEELFKTSANATFDQFTSKDFSVLEYIDQHSAENISVEKLASKCGMCYSTF